MIDETIAKAFETIISNLKQQLPISHTEAGTKDLNQLKQLTTDNAITITATTMIGNHARVNYTLTDSTAKKAKPQQDITFWNMLTLKDNSWILDTKTTFLEEKCKEEKWRSIPTERITFLFDYGIKKQTDEIMATLFEEELKKIEYLFNIKINEPITYFVCNDMPSLYELGFKRSYSTKNGIVSTSPCDIFELTNLMIDCIGSPPQLFRDGFAVYYTKFIAKSNSDTLSFNSSHIDRMAKEIIEHTPFPKIKKLLKTSEYHNAIHLLFVFTIMFTSKNQKINHDLVLFSPATSFIKYICEGNYSDKTKEERLTQFISLLPLNDIKEIKKTFKKLFGLRFSKCEKLWKKWLKHKR